MSTQIVESLGFKEIILKSKKLPERYVGILAVAVSIRVGHTLVSPVGGWFKVYS